MGIDDRSGIGWLMASAGWNVLSNRVIPARAYVPCNLGAAALAVAAARGTGSSWSDLGLARNRLRAGAGWGTLGAAVVSAAMVGASRWSITAGFFSDARATPERTHGETLVRIPLGTVVLEETLFRGVLPARITRSSTSSLAFGAWHVLPTASALDLNGVEDPATRRRAIAAGVIATAAAGEVLIWMRRRSGSVLAPMLAHWAANAVGYALAARQRRP